MILTSESLRLAVEGGKFRIWALSIENGSAQAESGFSQDHHLSWLPHKLKRQRKTAYKREVLTAGGLPACRQAEALPGNWTDRWFWIQGHVVDTGAFDTAVAKQESALSVERQSAQGIWLLF